MKKNNVLISIIVVLVIIIGILLVIFVPSLLKGEDMAGKGSGNTKTTDKIEVTDEIAKKYVSDFGLLENVTCNKTILDYGYTDDFKSILAITKAMDNSGVEKECSEVFDESLKVDNYSYKKDNYCWISQKTKVVDYDKVNKIYKKLYGSDVPKKSVNGMNIASMFYYFYDYIESTNSFATTSGNGLGGSCGPNYSITEYKDFSLDDNLLRINIYHSYGELEMNNDQYFVYFNNERFDCSKSEECESQIIKKYKDKLDLYELVLEYKDGNYIFNNLIKKLG